MNIFVLLLTMTGGLCMFLYGMKLMSDGLQKSAGERMRKAVNFMTSNRFVGVLTGFLVTAIVQSSSAVSVMVISFVTAGLLSLTQSIGVLFGANIGTTLTAWIVSLIGFKISIDSLAIPAIGVGFILNAIDWKYKSIGEFLLGFGFLFLGLFYLSDGIGQIKFDAHAIEAFKSMGFIAVLIAFGTSFVMTLIINSSTAAVAMIIIMAGSNVITYEMAAGMILGANIGTTTDGILASIGGPADSKRAALSHVLFNVVLACWALPLLMPVLKLVDIMVIGDPLAIVHDINGNIIDNPAIGFHLAMLHTMFKVLNTILFLPFVKHYAKLLTLMIRDKKTVEKKDEHYKFAYLSTPIANAPELNIFRAEKEISDMAGIVSFMYSRFSKALSSLRKQEGVPENKNDNKATVESLCADLLLKEQYIDEMKEILSGFLIDCSRLKLNPKSEKRLSSLLHVIVTLESMSDECYGISLLLEKSVSKDCVFKEKEMDVLIPYVGQVEEFLVLLENQLKTGQTPEQKARAAEMEEIIDKRRKKLHRLGRKRIEAGKNVKAELMFIDLVRRIERLGDYCFEISENYR
ncbi:MAG: Na/Pi cotransporter family protein [Treponema sp.]|nr:Na/Pi cotransporter family protein [Treponema sp.]MCL2252208.1 Na/Pi cotransporter family protein [Treponema sp.]